MICRATGGFRLGALEAQILQIELIDEDVDDSHRIIFRDVLVQALGEQRCLGSVLTFDVSLHS